MQSTDEEIPENVKAAFNSAPGGLLTLPQLAAALGWNVKNLRPHCDSSALVWRPKGLGRTRHHRVIALADFVAFWKAIAQGGPSTTPGHIGRSTSRSTTVIDLRALQNPEGEA